MTSQILRTVSWQIINPTSSLIPQNKDNLSVYNIHKLYWATLFSSFKEKEQYRTCLDIRDMSYSCMLLSWSSAGFPRSASQTFVITSEN